MSRPQILAELVNGGVEGEAIQRKLPLIMYSVLPQGEGARVWLPTYSKHVKM